MRTLTKATIFVALVHLIGRAALIISALDVVDGQYARSVILAMTVAVAMLAERALGSLERSSREASLHRSVLDAVFAHPTTKLTSSSQAVLVNGIAEAARLEAEVQPAAAADSIVALIIVVFAVSSGRALEAAGFLGCVAVGGAGVLVARTWLGAASKHAWQVYEDHVRRVWDGLSAAEEIVASGRTDAFHLQVEAGLHDLRRASRVLTLEASVLGRAPLVIGIGGGVLVGYVTGVIHPTATPLGVAVLATLLTPFAGLASAASVHLRAQGSVRAVHELLRTPPSKNGSVSPHLLDRISLRDVSASYGARDALSHVSFEAKRGITVLRGANGSGKSTILRLIVGVVAPSGGELTVGDNVASEIDWPRAREKMAYLPQRPYLPELDVREAMQFALGPIDDDTLERNLKCIDAWTVLVEKSPNDPLAASVAELSAGERQRIALARLLARDVTLYLLDEPDANLDQAGIETLSNLLRELSKRATIIMAAHTRAMVDIADEVVALTSLRDVKDAPRASKSA